jgi:hypothetical protein
MEGMRKLRDETTGTRIIVAGVEATATRASHRKECAILLFV